MNRVAVSVNRGTANAAVFVGHIVRFHRRFRPAPDRFGVSVIGIFDLKRDVVNAVAVNFNMLTAEMFRRHRSRKNEIHPILPHHITRRFTIARFQADISRLRKPECLAIKKLRLLRVADEEFEMMYFFQT